MSDVKINGVPGAASMTASTDRPLLEVQGISKSFAVRGGRRRSSGHLRAVDDVTLSIPKGTTMGLVGESGSGKSTFARLVTRLIEPSSGTVKLDGLELTNLSSSELRRVRRRMQFVFQDPYSSMDPRSNLLDSVGEPLRTHEKLRGRELRDRVIEAASHVGITASQLGRLPREISGGQLQRLAIARALSVNPDLVIFDEAVSSLDVSTQAQVINLILKLQREAGATYLFIAHDLAVVRCVSDSIAVMYVGRVVEMGDAGAVYSSPKHPYTAALLSSVPVPDPRRRSAPGRILLEGDVPNPLDLPKGCRFNTRCPHAMDVCRSVDPPAFTAADGVTVHCHLHTEGPRLQGESVLRLRAGSPA